MQRKSINPTGNSYSQAYEITGPARLLFISGQVPERGGRIPDGFRNQCLLAWKNVERQLMQAGMLLENLVKVTVFLSDRKYREENASIRAEVLGMHTPALTIIVCDIYDENWLLEIEAIAAA